MTLTLWDDPVLWEDAVLWGDPPPSEDPPPPEEPPPTPESTNICYFEPPIAYDLPPTLPGGGRINSHAKWKKGQRRGRSVLKTAGTYTTVDTPTVNQINAADTYYAGGHIHPITEAEAIALFNAGYTVILGLPGFLLTESLDFLTTEAGEPLMTEYV